MSKKQKNDYYTEKVNWLRSNGFEELDALDFYRLEFSEGSFQKAGESNGDYAPNGLLQFRRPDYAENSMSCCVVNDDLETIKNCLYGIGRFENHQFVLISGCSYIGSRKTNENARFCHAIIIDVDEVDASNLANLIGLADENIIPMPTALVVSGNGLHVVYVLDEKIPMYPQKAEMLKNLKAMLTRKIWNEKTSKDPNVQYQGIVQGYRAVGTRTKKDHIVRAFKIGTTVTIDELIETLTELDAVPFLPPNKGHSRGKNSKKVYSDRIENCIKDKHLNEKMLQELLNDHWTMEELFEHNPTWFESWYQRRVIENQKPGHLPIGRLAYDKWLQTIRENARQGNRRRCIYCLAAFAQKCDIPKEEFISDAYSLVEPFDKLTVDEKNHFTKSDVESVINQYKQLNLIKMSIKAMEIMTGITYPRKVKRTKIGRPDKEEIIKAYLEEHPNEKNVAKIARDCNCSRPTVYKFMKETDPSGNDED